MRLKVAVSVPLVHQLDAIEPLEQVQLSDPEPISPGQRAKTENKTISSWQVKSIGYFGQKHEVIYLDFSHPSPLGIKKKFLFFFIGAVLSSLILQYYFH